MYLNRCYPVFKIKKEIWSETTAIWQKMIIFAYCLLTVRWETLRNRQ
jgi:hypothetical protein